MSTTLPAPPLEPNAFKCTCTEWWGHPAVQLLVGDALRPGGSELTASLLDGLSLGPGVRALDVGSGAGVTLELLARRGMVATGVDYGATLATQAAQFAPTAIGDGERLPFPSESFTLVTMECVLSALPDKPAALREIRRVLVPGGTLVLTDMTVSRPLPEPLDSLLAWVACAGGALSSPTYHDLLMAHGFEVRRLEDHSATVGAFVAKARRRLALLRGAIKVGIVPDPEAMIGPELDALRASSDASGDLVTFGRSVLGEVADAVRAGQLGYCAIVAGRT
ncbi:MAG: class I SAM-dependent methyltransferase [Acidimicrobiia bacterium]